jgi:hypothetical protein
MVLHDPSGYPGHGPEFNPQQGNMEYGG